MTRQLFAVALVAGASLCANAQPQSSEEARRNFVSAVAKEAEGGKSQAQSFLGIMKEKGIGVPKNEAEAAAWYRKAADQGDGSAQSALALMYLDGRGVAKSESEAMKFFRDGALSALRAYAQRPVPFAGGAQGAIASAERGNPLAQTMAGWMYLAGAGVPQDDAEAVRWFTMGSKGFAAAGAQQGLGLLYEEGRGGLPKDNAEALRQYRKAAEQAVTNLESSIKLVYQFGPI